MSYHGGAPGIGLAASPEPAGSGELRSTGTSKPRPAPGHSDETRRVDGGPRGVARIVGPRGGALVRPADDARTSASRSGQRRVVA